MSSGQRKPLRLDRYLRIHEQNIQHLENAGFVLRDELSLDMRRHEVVMRGYIYCPGQVVITVNKRMTILDKEGKQPIVKTRKYEYNVSLSATHNLFRYDNTHKGKRYSGHLDDFHKHLFDLETGQPVSGSPKWIGEADWPTLGTVIEEACTLYNENRDLIDYVVRNRSEQVNLIT